MLCMLIIAKNVCFFNMFIFVMLMAGVYIANHLTLPIEIT